MLDLKVLESRPEGLAERIKNLDRWWYCVDMLLWCTGAHKVEVLTAKEERFSVSATLRLQAGALDSRLFQNENRF